ncbi:hypothetical protein MG293_012726 [Ovis ammon polii]|uniref:Uncharacterized protein n=1 Tax=Ovis ammon polii TaxID=230172 RepID=A0AAD4U1L8_OVIAM|nr:hypothetical protein MG293_012726 [Ovis ammon polii]
MGQERTEARIESIQCSILNVSILIMMYNILGFLVHIWVNEVGKSLKQQLIAELLLFFFFKMILVSRGSGAALTCEQAKEFWDSILHKEESRGIKKHFRINSSIVMSQMVTAQQKNTAPAMDQNNLKTKS